MPQCSFGQRRAPNIVQKLTVCQVVLPAGPLSKCWAQTSLRCCHSLSTGHSTADQQHQPAHSPGMRLLWEVRLAPVRD